MTGWLNSAENAIHLEDETPPPEILQEDGDDDDVVELRSIPAANTTSKRQTSGDGEDEDDALFVSSSDEDTFQTQRERPQKRRKQSAKGKANAEAPADEPAESNDKKKLSLSTSYDGFSIYGRILCLIVKRKGKKSATSTIGAPVGGSEMMEQWVSTQAAQEAGLDDFDEG